MSLHLPCVATLHTAWMLLPIIHMIPAVGADGGGEPSEVAKANFQDEYSTRPQSSANRSDVHGGFGELDDEEDDDANHGR